MVRLIALLMLGAAMPACASAPGEPMVITDVIANIDSLNGQTVRVVGYLGECQGYECRLFRNASEWRQVDAYFRGLRAAAHQGRSPSVTTNDLPYLGIGAGENFAFDRQAAPFQNGYVVITGRVSNLCRYQGRPGCTDRTTDLEPTGIERWSPPSSQTENRS